MDVPTLTRARRLLVKVSQKHVTSIIEGVVRDTVDPRARLIWGWYERA
jgi:hypothetical protein